MLGGYDGWAVNEGVHCSKLPLLNLIEACCNVYLFQNSLLKSISKMSYHFSKRLKNQVEPGHKWTLLAKTIPNSLNLGVGGNCPFT